MSTPSMPPPSSTRWLEGFFSHGEAADCRGGAANDESDSTPSPSGEFVAESAPATPGEALERAGPPQNAVLYLHGPRRAGQTSLLLQLAFTLASAGRSVVAVLFGDAEQQQQERRDNPIVRLSPCRKCGKPETTGQDSAVWARISIKYLQSSAELQQFLCSFHLVRAQTSALLVDGFERFFSDDSHMSDVYQTLAFALETARYMSQSGGQGLALVAGATDTFVLRDRQALRRWCRFVQITEDAAERGLFCMREEPDEEDDEGIAGDGVRLRYEFALPRGAAPGEFQLVDIQGSR